MKRAILILTVIWATVSIAQEITFPQDTLRLKPGEEIKIDFEVVVIAVEDDSAGTPPDTTQPDTTAGTFLVKIDDRPGSYGPEWFTLILHNKSTRTLGRIIFDGIFYDYVRSDDLRFILGTNTNDADKFNRRGVNVLMVNGDIASINIVHKSQSREGCFIELYFGADMIKVPIGMVENAEVDVPPGDSTPGGTANIKVKWDPNKEYDLSGYRTHVGLWPGESYTSIDVGNVTEWDTIILRGKRYNVGVSAYDYSGNESTPTIVDYVAE